MRKRNVQILFRLNEEEAEYLQTLVKCSGPVSYTHLDVYKRQVQDRLIAIHNLDCPWRPSDLEQRQGRIERQGNLFPEVEVYRYVTEQTFDAYLYQLVESKQKFISQIMTSKSPVRSAEDVDEVALSFAEVKMLATGDERFKEKMDLDIQVSKLRVLKQSYLSEHYDLEDRILQQFPKLIKEYELSLIHILFSSL